MKKFYPVIHVKDFRQVLKNVEIAVSAKADGVFIIAHTYIGYKDLIKIGKGIKKIYPDLFIGYNFLDLASRAVFEMLEEAKFYPDAIWVDDTFQGTNEKHSNDIVEKWKSYKESGFNGLYFGGVAFKYCKQPKDLSEATKNSINNMDIVITSGDGTGISADLSKIKTMYEVLNGKAELAIASGITPDNISNYLPYVDNYLVATGISIDEYNLDAEKTSELSEKIHRN